VVTVEEGYDFGIQQRKPKKNQCDFVSLMLAASDRCIRQYDSQIVSANAGRTNSSLKRSWTQRDDMSADESDETASLDASSVHILLKKIKNIDAPRVPLVDETTRKLVRR